MKSFILSLLILSTALISSLHAQGGDEKSTTANNNKTVYVTDALQLKLNSAKNGKGEELDSLQSGDALTLLNDQGTYSRVLTENGIEGWVTSFYLTEKIPTQRRLKDAKNQLAERNASIRQLEEQLQNMTQGEPSGNPGLLTELESKVVLLNQENVMMTNDKEQLRKKLVQAELALSLVIMTFS
jgi:SH3 domain protein